MARLVVLSAAVFLFGMGVTAAASEPTVSVGVILSNPPYVTENPSRGIDNDIVRGAFQNAGYGVSFAHAPLSRLDSLFDDRKVEAITVFHTDRAGCALSEPFSYWHDGLIVRRELAEKVHGVADLRGMTVGTFPRAELALGDQLAPYLASFARRISVFRTDLVTPMLERSRIDAYIGDVWAVEAAYKKQAGRANTPAPFVVATYFRPTPRWLCFHDAALAKAFNGGLRKLKASGAYDAIIARYHPIR